MVTQGEAVAAKALVDGSQTALHSHTGGGQALPVGSVFIAVVNTNPNTLLGYGTWTQIAGGRVLIGQTGGDVDFDVAEETGGAKTSTAIVNHVHVQKYHATSTGALAGNTSHDVSSSNPQPSGISTSDPTGGAASMSLMNPYFVVYIWKRTA